jgi:hypothetical protein
MIFTTPYLVQSVIEVPHDVKLIVDDFSGGDVVFDGVEKWLSHVHHR